MTDRIEEIRERLNNGEALYPDDPIVLLSRVVELETENEQLQAGCDNLAYKLSQRENELAEVMRGSEY